MAKVTKLFTAPAERSAGTILIYTPGLMVPQQAAHLVKLASAGHTDDLQWSVINIGDTTPPPPSLKGERVVLIGYSAGGHRVTAYYQKLVDMGADVVAVFYVDGTHIRDPKLGGQSMPEAPLRAIIERAMQNDGPIVWVSHTYLTYTDQIRDNPATPEKEIPFLSTATTMRKLTGLELVEPGSPGGIAVHSLGRMTIYSYENGETPEQLRAAHRAQLSAVLPYLLEKLLARLDDEDRSGEEIDDDEESHGTEESDPSTMSLGEVYAGSDEEWEKLPRGLRLLHWAGGEMGNGVKEDPATPNDSARLRDYRLGIPYTRKNPKSGIEEPLDMRRIGPSPWCAMAVSYGLLAVSVSDDEPFVPRVSGLELAEDAKREGRSIDPKLPAKPGSIAIWERKTAGGGGWERHVTIVVSDDGEAMRTIGGNEANAWSPAEGVTHNTRPLAVIDVG